MDYSKHYQTKVTPQSEPIPGSGQVENSAGGFAWAVDDWTRLDRFLILGSEGGSYYATERKLTKDNAEAVVRCIKADGPRAVKRIAEISTSGRAPKNDPALFALALCMWAGDDLTRHEAAAALPKVARTGTHLFTFVVAIKSLRGWGRSLRRAIAQWYNEKPSDRLAYQMIKYQSRNEWSHRDVLRLAHPHPATEQHDKLYRWSTKGEKVEGVNDLLDSYLRVQAATEVKDVVRAIGSNPSLTWEMIPSQFLGDPAVWGALLPNMPMMATVRNLARMTANGLIQPLSGPIGTIVGRLHDEEAIRRSRIHPISLLGALNVYAQGHGARGKLSWTPVPQILDALNDAFYLSFGNVRPTGKRTLIGLDVSSSMNSPEIGGMPGLTPRNTSCALSLVTASVEPQYAICVFTDQFLPTDISKGMRLDHIVKTMSRLPFGRTDCSIPMTWAAARNLEVDTFVIYTDSETWYGPIHPAQALKQYRQKSGIASKLVVCGMVANEFSIADPTDAGMLDVIGFDTATPQIISDFSSGEQSSIDEVETEVVAD